ncbi:MAG: ATP-binding protein [Agathobacter sp.]|nr:ATP-binding protein [Agathobacter sp.]
MVQEVSISFEQSNMNSFLVKGQLFSNPDIFLRELLKNACDACNMREALELSWGMDFLEQISSSSHMVRKAYEPKIFITYDSKSKMFTMEDNGFGINDEDLREYVAKFGKSYYTSEAFAKQHLDFEPVSKNGVGLYSCFVVSKAILIESRKHHSINTAWMGNERQSLEAITVKWFENSDKIEYIQSTKGAAGTRVSMALKSYYAQKMSLDFIIKSIDHYMMKQQIPIVVRYDDKTVEIEPQVPHLTNPFSNILGMTGIQIKENWIEGYLVLHTKRQSCVAGQSIIYQQGFRILEDGKDLGICPPWLENLHFVLNLKQNFYTLQVGGNGVVKDKNWRVLREAVGKLIIGHFKGSPVSMCQYLADGEQNILSEFEEEMEFVCRAAYGDVFWKNQELELSVEQIVSGLKGRKTRIIRMPKALFMHFRDTYPKEFEMMMKDHPLVLFEKNFKIFSQLLAPFVVNQEYMMPRLAGIQYIKMEVDFSRPADYEAYKNEYQLYPKICPRDDIFCYVINDQPEYFELKFNEKHPMASLLMGKDHPRIIWLLGVIAENIKYRILHSQNRWKKIMDFGGVRVDSWNMEAPVTLKAEWCLEEDFAEELNEFIRIQFTPAEKRELGIEKLIFTKGDFIEWWYSPC